MTKGFDWKRFWGPRDGSIDLSDRGFLSDPDDEWTKHLNPQLISFDSLGDLRCVVLLGEPGIGKSWALQQERSRVQSSLEADAKLVSVDLRSFGDESRLMAFLFDSELFESWRNADWQLHLHLDSLDECLLRIDNVAALLADELQKQPVERLRLRIACRTAPWPAILERALENAFGECHAYDLAPLRRIDVQRAAEQSGISDPSVFLARIDELDVSSLAIKPVTLKFLISTYLRDGDFPKNHLALYEKGCRMLCEETNPSRLGSSRRGRLSPEERLAVASRIAAVTQLCKRFAVFVGTESDGAPPEDVFINDLSGGVEHAGGNVAMSVDAVLETLDTGLFSSRGLNRIGWAHQTYAEFLTARYCCRREMPIEQIRSLVFHPADQGRRLIPQLHEVAAWMSATAPEVLEAVVKSDPEALLGAAAASLSESQRRLVVDSLLQQTSEGRALHLRWGLFWLYRKLKHSGLANQIRPYLIDTSKPLGTRHVAIDIARSCKVEELGPDLADIGLDRSEDLALRNSAAATAADVVSRDVRARLRPLAFGETGDDPDDELKGSGLRAIWPDFIGAAELFPLLTPPKNSGLSGNYSRFLYDHVTQKLAAKDLPLALDWFSKQENRQHLLGPMDRMMDQIVELAWENLNEPGVASGLALAIVSRLKRFDSILSSTYDGEFATKVQQDEERRRALLKALFPRLNLNGVNRLDISRIGIVVSADMDWLIDRILSGETEYASVEARLVLFTFDWRDQKAFAKLWSACQTNAILNAECGGLFAQVQIDSELAKMLREQLEQEKEWKTPKLLSPSPSELIESHLKSIEAGDVVWWPRLTMDLTLKPTSSHYGDLGSDLTETPGWKAADADVRKRILDAAVRYLLDGDPLNDQWFGTTSIHGEAIGGFHALGLLLVTDGARLESLSKDAWAKWVPVLLRIMYAEKDEPGLQSRLLRRAHELLPNETTKRIIELIDAENERGGHLFLAKEIDICWDVQLGAALLDKAKGLGLKSEILGAVLEFLIHHNVPGGQECAESFINGHLADSKEKKSQAVVAVQVLLRCTSDATWKKIWPIFQKNKLIGREIVEAASYGHAGGANFIGKLNEADLGKFYLWMVENYPYSSQRRTSGAMGPSDTVVMLRDAALESLKKKGSFAARDAILDVMEKLPQYGWLRHHLEEAELLARANTWTPVSISEFLALASNREKRFVDSGSQLVEIILEALERLRLKLHDELPASRDLWNTPKGGFSPKDEQDVADYVARHLREDLRDRGIIVNREVQIRRGIGDGTGQRTDIHVDASSPRERTTDFEEIYAILEVKGNWNAELLEAMKTQLRDRYLRENRCRNGVYLPAWFTSAKWSDADPRKKQCVPMSLSEAQEYFSRQAAELSTEGYWIRSYVLDTSLS